MKIHYNLEQSQTFLTDETWRECIGSCHAYLTLREDYRAHVRKVQKEIGFKQIRFHGLLHDLVGIYHGYLVNSIDFNFQNVFKIFDFFLSVGLKPFIELSFMPNQLASGDKRLFKYEANITPPKDYNIWKRMITELTESLIKRYGLAEVTTWKFEVWNEPESESFWAGGQAGYFELYQQTAHAIKAVNEKLQVGGPASSKVMWIDETIAFCETTQTPIDFFSTHHYCCDISFEAGNERSDVHFRGQEVMKKEVMEVRQKVDNSSYKGYPIDFTEWNVSPIHEDRYGKDSSFTASFVLQTLRDVSPYVRSYSYWTISDIFEESGPSLYPFSGKYGLVNIHGIPKAVYHAYHFLAQLYPVELKDTSAQQHQDIMVTKSYNNDIRILAWHHPKVEAEDMFGGDYKLARTTKALSIDLSGLKGRYRIRILKVNESEGNALSAWQNMGEPQYLTDAQIEELFKKAKPKQEEDKICDIDGHFLLEAILQPTEMRFISIEHI